MLIPKGRRIHGEMIHLIGKVYDQNSTNHSREPSKYSYPVYRNFGSCTLNDTSLTVVVGPKTVRFL